jgi:hypothetical protein
MVFIYNLFSSIALCCEVARYFKTDHTETVEQSMLCIVGYPKTRTVSSSQLILCVNWLDEEGIRETDAIVINTILEKSVAISQKKC